MTRNEKSRLFKPYFKSDGEAKRGIESNGMGLSVSQQIAKSMDGQIEHVDIADGC